MELPSWQNRIVPAERDPRLDLIIAYREAGLVEKADELTKEMLAEQGIVSKSMDDISTQLKDMRETLDKRMGEFYTKFGIPRQRKPKKRKK